MTVLVDANVLLDVLAERHPHHTAALSIWSFVETKKIDGVVSAISLSNIYYIARKSLGKEKAMEAVRAVAGSFRIAPVDDRVIDGALNSAMTDFEDAIQAFSGARLQATHVVTRDATGFDTGPLIALTPDALLSMLPV